MNVLFHMVVELIQNNINANYRLCNYWIPGATVARSTPDRKVICSNQVGFIIFLLASQEKCTLPKLENFDTLMTYGELY